MKDQKIIDTLAWAYNHDRMGPFYIINAISGLQSEREVCLNETWEGFKKEINAENSVDIYEYAPTDGDYKVSEFPLADFFLQVSFRPLELKRRFFVFHRADCLGKTMANKLLKTLEGPGEETTIIFFNLGIGQMLPTIESRAQKFYLATLSSTYPPLSGKTGEILQSIVKKNLDERELIEQVIHQLSLKDNYRDLQKAIDLIESYQQNLTYKNNAMHRCYPLINFCLEGT